MEKSDRKLVMLKPDSAIERFFRARFSAIMILWSVACNPETKEALTKIIFNSQSWTTKMERIKAEFYLRCGQEMFSERNLSLLGMRKVRCQCGAGVGHNQPPVRALSFS